MGGGGGGWGGGGGGPPPPPTPRFSLFSRCDKHFAQLTLLSSFLSVLGGVVRPKLCTAPIGGITY
jgi:hypothetical protein